MHWMGIRSRVGKRFWEGTSPGCLPLFRAPTRPASGDERMCAQEPCLEGHISLQLSGDSRSAALGAQFRIVAAAGECVRGYRRLAHDLWVSNLGADLSGSGCSCAPVTRRRSGVRFAHVLVRRDRFGCPQFGQALGRWGHGGVARSENGTGQRHWPRSAGPSGPGRS